MDIPREGYLALHPLVVDENTVPQYYRLLPTDDPNHQLAPLTSNTELELEAGRGRAPRVTFLRAPTTRSTRHVAWSWDEEQQTAPLAGVASKVPAEKVKENLYRLITFYLAFVPFWVTTGFVIANYFITRVEIKLGEKAGYTSADLTASLGIASTGAVLIFLVLTPLVGTYITYYHYPFCVCLRRGYATLGNFRIFAAMGAYGAVHVVCDVAGTVVLRYAFGADLGGIDARRAAHVGWSAAAFGWLAMWAVGVVVWLSRRLVIFVKQVVQDIVWALSDEDTDQTRGFLMPLPMSFMDLCKVVANWIDMHLQISV